MGLGTGRRAVLLESGLERWVGLEEGEGEGKGSWGRRVGRERWIGGGRGLRFYLLIRGIEQDTCHELPSSSCTLHTISSHLKSPYLDDRSA